MGYRTAFLDPHGGLPGTTILKALDTVIAQGEEMDRLREELLETRRDGSLRVQMVRDLFLCGSKLAMDAAMDPAERELHKAITIAVSAVLEDVARLLVLDVTEVPDEHRTS